MLIQNVRAFLFSFCFLGILWCQVGAATLPEDWQVVAKARKPHGNVEMQVTVGESVELLVEAKGSQRQAVLVLGDDHAKGYELREGKRMPLRERVSYAVPPASSKSRAILVKIRDFEWSVYLDGRLHKVFSAPFILPGTLARRKGQAARFIGKPKCLAVPTARFVTNFMIEPGAKDELYPWNIQTGRWHLHTALEQSRIRPETSQGNLKRAPLTADKSPNFYSLKGGGKDEDCIITTGFEVYDDYRMTGSIQLTTGEAGLIVYHRDEDVPEGRKPNPAKAEFYAFTLRRNVPELEWSEARLWQQKDGRRQVLARAQVPVYENQWTLPGIAVHGDEIICYMDHWEVFRFRKPLTRGGKFGLYAKSPEEIRMDDVTVEPFADIQLETMDGLRFHAEALAGEATVGGKAWAQAPGNAPADVLLGGKNPSALLLGRPHVQGGVFSVHVCPEKTAWNVGLKAGWQAVGKPGYEFSVERKGDAENYELRAGGKLLESFRLDRPLDREKAFELMADASEPGLVRFLKGGRVIFAHPVPKTFGGCVGVFTGSGTRASCRRFALADHRLVSKELEQKNPVFQKDSFMRHWASPEGQWIAGKGGAMWHKGDFFGDFYLRMPCIPGSQVNLGVPDDKLEGPVVISIAGKTMVLKINRPLLASPIVRNIPLTPPQGKGVDALDYELHCEGLCLWIDVAGKRVAYEHLLNTLRESGTRIFSKGLGISHLARTKVTRSNVIDEFFNESPFMWTANGGDWQIINRFQCTPSWSHMIGQSLNSMGAFWRKQIFRGDMTLEFYAGTRHGYYDTMGNLNCTIMADGTTVNSGYTATCTEWDQNLSQNWSRLYKNGKKLKETQAYLVPRRRKGMYRRIKNPLLAEGRPYHGAWYYIKLRKIGEKLEYYFDDELIFTERDPQMIQEGMVGIWTFMHSMTLAQIKITYDQVRPRPVPVRQMTLTETVKPEKLTVPLATTVNRWPVDSLGATGWKVNDPVGQSTCHTFHTTQGTGKLLKNRLGAGRMLLEAKLPPLPLNEIAGWTFLVKRTEKARFNVFYQIYNHKNQLIHRIFHQISGENFTHGPWRKAGASTVPGQVCIAPEDSDWTRVTVWIPTRFRHDVKGTPSYMLHFGGFGIEQDSILMTGLGGNGPGEGYAVTGLTPIRYDAPLLAVGKGETIRGFADSKGQRPVSGTTPKEVEQALTAMGRAGLNRMMVEVTKTGRTLRQPVFWVKEAPIVPLEVAWDDRYEDCVRVKSSAPYPHRDFQGAQLYRKKRQLKKLWEEDAGIEAFSAPLPRKIALPDNLDLTVQLRGQRKQVTLSMKDARRINQGPVLLWVDGFTPCCFTYEKDKFRVRGKGKWQFVGAESRFLHLRNTRLGQRLRMPHSLGLSVAEFPVAQFQYRASDMAYVSLQFDEYEEAFVRLTDQDGGVPKQVRLGRNLVTDDTWRIWTGIVSDAFCGDALLMKKFKRKRLCFRSVDARDQTGRYSSFDLDNLVFGPAVHQDQQLEFTPKFFDADGVRTVQVARLAGPVPYQELSEKQRQTLIWVEIKPGEKIKPSLNGLSDGVHHLVLRGVDVRGKVGETVDLPFMVDRKPLAFTHKIVKSNNPLDNGVALQVDVAVAGGAPWCSDKATFQIGKGAPHTTLNGWQSSFVNHANKALLTLNYPLIFRERLDRSKDGEVLEVRLDNLSDGAGNRTPPVVIPIKVDYKSDKQGPSWYELQAPPSVAKLINWDGKARNMAFEVVENGEGRILSDSKQSPCLQHRTHRAQGALMLNGLAWKPARQPYVACRAWRNVIRPKTTVNLVLTLKKPVKGQQDYVISLTVPGQSKTDLNRTETFTWKPKTWHPFLFNVPELMLKAGIEQKEIDQAVVMRMTIRRRGTAHRDELRLDDLVIFGAPDDGKKPDLLTWTAYDASGVASLNADCIGDNGDVLFTHRFSTAPADLNQLRTRFKGVKWFKWYAKDKAGNASVPFWMPVSSR